MPEDLRTTLLASAAGDGPRLRRGLWVTYLDAYGLEVAASGGMDWLGVDLQHGNLEPRQLPGLLRVAEGAGLPLLARVPSHDPATLGRVLDAAVDGVIVPMVNSAEQAAALVAACRLPPDGRRSTGGCRATLGVRRHPDPQLLFAMIETAAGLRNAAQILAVPGIDGVFVGPYDLSLSAGYPGPDAPQTIEALHRVIALARTAGRMVGFMAGRPGLLAAAADADLVAVDTDVSALRLGLARLLADAGS